MFGRKRNQFAFPFLFRELLQRTTNIKEQTKSIIVIANIRPIKLSRCLFFTREENKNEKK